MMRSPGIQHFIDCLADGFRTSPPNADVAQMACRLFADLRHPASAGQATPARFPVCHHLPEALLPARSATPILSSLAEAFAMLEPELHWAPRPSSGPHASANWQQGHANATLIGPGGLEERRDVWIGASLMAAHVRYPDHSHGPEEIYLVMTPGRFQHGNSEWFTPGIGGTLHNVPNIRHAMASEEMPFLAFWCLLLADSGRNRAT